MTDHVYAPFIGLQIEGDYTATDVYKTEQWSEELLAERLNEVLSDPTLVGLRWEQYTPYWNDGEPCTFGVNELRARWNETDPDSGDYEDGFNDLYYSFDPEEKVNMITYNKLCTLSRDWDHFEDVLRDKFGDHAEITIWNGKNIQVDFYEHD